MMRIANALVVAACLVGASALAGCASEEQATAKQLQPYAEEIAVQWASDATLQGLMGLEGSQRYEQMGNFADQWSGHAMMDPRLGDGRMELWRFSFITANKDNTVLHVGIDRDGNVVWQYEEEMMPHLELRRLGEYAIDSDVAASIASGANQGIRDANSDPGGVTEMTLFLDDRLSNGPMWSIYAQVRSGPEKWSGGNVAVSANSGQILHNVDFSDPDWPEQ